MDDKQRGMASPPRTCRGEIELGPPFMLATEVQRLITFKDDKSL